MSIIFTGNCRDFLYTKSTVQVQEQQYISGTVV